MGSGGYPLYTDIIVGTLGVGYLGKGVDDDALLVSSSEGTFVCSMYLSKCFVHFQPVP